MSIIGENFVEICKEIILKLQKNNRYNKTQEKF